MANEAAIRLPGKVAGFKGVIRALCMAEWVDQWKNIVPDFKNRRSPEHDMGSYNDFDPDAIIPYFFMTPRLP